MSQSDLWNNLKLNYTMLWFREEIKRAIMVGKTKNSNMSFPSNSNIICYVVSSFTSLCHILVCHPSTFNKNGERETLLSWTFVYVFDFSLRFFWFYSFYTSIITLTLHILYFFFSLPSHHHHLSISCFLPIIFSRVNWPFIWFQNSYAFIIIIFSLWMV